MRTWLLLLAILPLLRPSPVWATTEENEAGMRLTAEATEFLDQLLGPGKAKVLVTVQGERSETRTQSEITTPIKKTPTPAPAEKAEEPTKFLPGYSQTPTPKPKDKSGPDYDYLQKDQEQTLRQSGLIIKFLHATVILDSSVPEAQKSVIKQVMPDLLRMDANRGDILTVLSAPMMPPWQRMFMAGEGLRVIAQDGIRALLYFVVAMCVIFFLGLVAYLIAMRAIRVFVSEVERLRESREPMQPALPQPAGGEELPELMPGGMPSLEAEATEGDLSQQPVAALGHRFDFLNDQPLDDLSDSLAKEKAEDLALLFGSLTDSNETLATRLFAVLPSALQTEVSQHLSKLTNYDPEKLSQLESRLHSLVEYGVRGSDRLGRLLSRIPAQQREGILGEMMNLDPAAVEKVESSMIPFESLADVAAPELRRLLTAVPYQEWGTALRGAPEDMVKRILEQFPAEAQAALRDYLEQPQPMDKVLEARSKILSQAYDLASKGQLTITKRGSSSSSQLI